MGYHQLDAGEHLPFFLVEGHKRLMVLAYSCDKDLATFLGCPPLIPYRFCRIKLPLDLTPAEVVAHPVVREAAISKLDAKGWNTKEPIKGSRGAGWPCCWATSASSCWKSPLIAKMFTSDKEPSMPSATTLLRWLADFPLLVPVK